VLGLLRTEELLAARRLDGARQFFTRAIDWGFSKTAAEAFTMWPREELLRDVVAVVRYFRPDIIVSVFTGTPRDGHGQHQAAGIMAAEAFEAAADPSRFPDQVAAGLRPHAATHLYRVGRGPEDGAGVELMTGELDPLLGRSHFQVAMASRSRHRSQDMGQLLRAGPQTSTLVLAETRAEAPPSGSLFAGVDTTLWAIATRASSLPGGSDPLANTLTRYEATIDDARRTFNPFFPGRIVPFLTEAARMLENASQAALERGDAAAELAFQLAREREELDAAILRAARVEVDAIAADETVVPGQTFELQLQLWNGGDAPVQLTSLEPRLPAGWTAEAGDAAPARVEPGSLVTRTFAVTVPADALPTQPYFHVLPPEEARYQWPEDAGPVGVPFQPDVVRAAAAAVIGGVSVEAGVDATFRDVDQWRGEFRRPVRVVPTVAVTVDPPLTVLPLARSDRSLRLAVRLVAEAPDGISGTLRFDVPAGWRVEPAEVPMSFAAAGEERTIEVVVHPAAGVGQERSKVTAFFVDESGSRFDRGYALVDYEHVRPRPLYRQAALEVQGLDVELPEGLRIGYIASAADPVPAALIELGVDLDLLEPQDLAFGPLDVYDVIVVGIRAYESRPDLVTHNQRLLDYVAAGGTAVVQYNQYQYTAPGLAPYPLTIARPHDRVTDETAAVTLLQPDHPIFNSPNRLTPEDFEGWVQERGLYFLNSWDDRYTPLIEMADPGEEPNRGSLVIAEYGEGTYVYTGLALFRQLPAGVAGAYRLVANLLALGAQ